MMATDLLRSWKVAACINHPVSQKSSLWGCPWHLEYNWPPQAALSIFEIIVSIWFAQLYTVHYEVTWRKKRTVVWSHQRWHFENLFRWPNRDLLDVTSIFGNRETLNFLLIVLHHNNENYAKKAKYKVNLRPITPWNKCASTLLSALLHTATWCIWNLCHVKNNSPFFFPNWKVKMLFLVHLLK